jgi:hypothetical protein
MDLYGEHAPAAGKSTGQPPRAPSTHADKIQSVGLVSGSLTRPLPQGSELCCAVPGIRLYLRRDCQVKRHQRDSYFVVGEGLYAYEGDVFALRRPSTLAELRKFRFSRLGPEGPDVDESLSAALAPLMTASGQQPNSSIPAGFTYLGQFLDHDLTMDRTAVDLGDTVQVAELLQGRSPALDLDSLYGRGPNSADSRFYAADGVRLKTGTTAPVPIDAGTNVPLQGHDLPRVGAGSTRRDRRQALIPDHRNDENLAVAQTHLAFIRFHNAVVDLLEKENVPGAMLFVAARRAVVKHYQWMVRTDFLPRIVDPDIVNDVFINGRKVFEVPAAPGYSRSETNGQAAEAVGQITNEKALPGDRPTMPIEFSVAAYRLGHSMVRGAYQWNRVFNSGGGPLGIATLFQLFTFSGTSGNLTPTDPSDLAAFDDPDSGFFERLPTNWVPDFRRLYDFTEIDRDDLAAPTETGGGNNAQLIDTLLVNPLGSLPTGAFAELKDAPPVASLQRNLAFRNLIRAGMVNLASGQQMADRLGLPQLTADQLITGNGGADLSELDEDVRKSLIRATPLWFYVLREAELNGGVLTGVGGRIVAEVFHRAIEGSDHSIVRDQTWRPSIGNRGDKFTMADLLVVAFDNNLAELNPLGDETPTPAPTGHDSNASERRVIRSGRQTV